MGEIYFQGRDNILLIIIYYLKLQPFLILKFFFISLNIELTTNIINIPQNQIMVWSF